MDLAIAEKQIVSMCVALTNLKAVLPDGMDALEYLIGQCAKELHEAKTLITQIDSEEARNWIARNH